MALRCPVAEWMTGLVTVAAAAAAVDAVDAGQESADLPAPHTHNHTPSGDGLHGT